MDASSFRPAGTLNAAAALAPYRGPWNPRLAAHLLRRAGFGGSPDDVRRVAALPLHDAVDAFLAFPSTPALSQAPPELPDPLPLELQVRALVQAHQPVDPELRKQVAQTRRAAVIALQTWWLGRMIASPAPLQEKMTLFWHTHFTSAYGQKGITSQDMLGQNRLFRSNALGNAHALTLAVSQDPAMLKYLDNARNDKAHPNENYARELMELFTLGIGNYSEQDVRESARSFTGWTVRGFPSVFYDNVAQHDQGQKTFLGHTGNLDGKDVVDIIFAQPAAARFLAQKLLAFFVYSDPEPALVEGTAQLVRRHDFELRPVMSVLLRSNVFFSDRAYRALVKSPVEFVVGTQQLFGVQTVSLPTLGGLVRMGQILFYPPNVKGWDGGIAWLNTQTVLSRENFASAFTQAPQMMDNTGWLGEGGTLTAPQLAGKLVGTILQGDASPASVAKLESYLNGADSSALGALSYENYEERLRGAAYLTMAMPAYQLA